MEGKAVILLKYKDRSYIVIRRRRVVMSLISHPYSD